MQILAHGILDIRNWNIKPITFQYSLGQPIIFHEVEDFCILKILNSQSNWLGNEKKLAEKWIMVWTDICRKRYIMSRFGSCSTKNNKEYLFKRELCTFEMMWSQNGIRLITLSLAWKGQGRGEVLDKIYLKYYVARAERCVAWDLDLLPLCNLPKFLE